MGSFSISNIFDQYLWPFFILCFVGVVLYGVLKNFKALFGNDGESRKEGLIDLVWIVCYALAALGVISVIVMAVKSSKPSLG
ncbi:hypothetical protein [Sphingobacterium kitahiroshimense]|uniref:hypothetical protein n=1 Tax=Sphingobacterium kitahiroshimense TaxID=470446 RepID=UPI0032098445